MLFTLNHINHKVNTNCKSYTQVQRRVIPGISLRFMHRSNSVASQSNILRYKNQVSINSTTYLRRSYASAHGGRFRISQPKMIVTESEVKPIDSDISGQHKVAIISIQKLTEYIDNLVIIYMKLEAAYTRNIFDIFVEILHIVKHPELYTNGLLETQYDNIWIIGTALVLYLLHEYVDFIQVMIYLRDNMNANLPVTNERLVEDGKYWLKIIRKLLGKDGDNNE